MLRQHPSSTLFPYTTLFRSHSVTPGRTSWRRNCSLEYSGKYSINKGRGPTRLMSPLSTFQSSGNSSRLVARRKRSEEHTSELQSRPHLVCRLLLEKKKSHTH